MQTAFTLQCNYFPYQGSNNRPLDGFRLYWGRRSLKQERTGVNQHSTAAQIIIAIIPIAGIVMGSVVIFFYLLWNHKRRTLLIKAGQYKRPEFDLLSFSLLAGLLLGAAGLALTVFLAVLLGKSFGVLGGIIPLAIGAGLLVYYGIKRSDKSP
jgi:hypothetical protein